MSRSANITKNGQQDFGLGGSNSLKTFLKDEKKILKVKPDALDTARDFQENANV